MDRINEVYDDLRTIIYSDQRDRVEETIQKIVNDESLGTTKILGAGFTDKHTAATETLRSINRVMRGISEYAPDVPGISHSFLEKATKDDAAHVALVETIFKNPSLVAFYNKRFISGTMRRAGMSLDNPFIQAAVIAGEGAKGGKTSMFRSPMRSFTEDAAHSIARRITTIAPVRTAGLAAAGLALAGAFTQPSFKGNVDTLPDDLMRTVRTRLTEPGPGFIDKIVTAAFNQPPTTGATDRKNVGLPPRPNIRSVYANRRIGDARYRT